jgi:polyferredoxin
MKKVENKKLFYILLGALAIIIVVFTWMFSSKYKQANTFDFAQVSPQGYFTDLKTSAPDSPVE